MRAWEQRGRSFYAMAAYLMNGRSGKEQDRVAWHATRSLPTTDPGLAVAFMQATAAQNYRVQTPAFYITLNFHPDDRVERAVMERVCDRALERLGLTEHQALLVAHRDRPHAHVHIVVCRLHPETGRAWSAWEARTRVAETLRDAEREFGLREEKSWIPRNPTREQEPTLFVARSPGRASGARERTAEWAGVGSSPPRTAIALAAADVRLYERVIDRIRQQYQAQVDASGARARETQVTLAAERAQAAQSALARALARVYRDPEQAFDAYKAAVDNRGIGPATRLMREAPEQFGTLLTIRGRRALGLLRREDDRHARAAAPAAATRAREAIEAAKAFGTRAGEFTLRRAEEAFARELEMVYSDPQAARTAFDRISTGESGEQVIAILKERPAVLCAVRASVSADATRFKEQMEGAATRAADVLRARVAMASASTRLSPALLEQEQAFARAALAGATARDAAAQAELRALPSRAALEQRLSYTLRRLAPIELERLERCLTAPQVAIARQLWRAGRNLARGHEEERDQAAGPALL